MFNVPAFNNCNAMCNNVYVSNNNKYQGIKFNENMYPLYFN
jgi:hypothetical protein